MHSWIFDGLEGRPNCRILCHDPVTKKTSVVLKNLIFPNGICVAHDGASVYFVETYGCRVSRFWVAGPRAGKVDVIIDNLPGHPDNINRASDGTSWLALADVRSPFWELGSGIWRW